MGCCASCKYITHDVVRGDRCLFTGRRADNGKYCKNYEMLCDTEEASEQVNNYRMSKVIKDNKRK